MGDVPRLEKGQGIKLLDLQQKDRKVGDYSTGTNIFGKNSADIALKSYKNVRPSIIKPETGKGRKFLALEKEMEKRGITDSKDKISFLLGKMGKRGKG